MEAFAEGSPADLEQWRKREREPVIVMLARTHVIDAAPSRLSYSLWKGSEAATEPRDGGTPGRPKGFAAAADAAAAEVWDGGA